MEKADRKLFLIPAGIISLLIVALLVFRHHDPPQPIGRVGGDCAPNPRQTGAVPAAAGQPTLTNQDVLGFVNTVLSGRITTPADQIWANLSAEEARRRQAVLKDYGLEPSTAQGKLGGIYVTGWQGWIARIAPGLYAHEKDLYTIGLYLNDPFAAGSASRTHSGVSISEFSDADLCCVSTQDARTLSIGQRVVFCGEIGYTTLMRADQTIADVGAPIINPQANAETSSAVIPADFQVHYEEHGCGESYSCPDFSVDINATGAVRYQGKSGVRVAGSVTGQANSQKLQELVQLVGQIAFFADAESSPSPAPLEAGATLVAVTMGGQRGAVTWPWRGIVPRSIRLLPEKVHEVADVWQWIRLWPEIDDD